MILMTSIEARIELAYRNGVYELSAALHKDLGDLIRECLQHHHTGTKRMKEPTLLLWADTDDAGKISIRRKFADSCKRTLKGEMYLAFRGASYQEVADMVSKLRPVLCSYDAVSRLVQSARPRLESKHFGEAA